MSFSASSAHSNTDERVLDVQFTDDAISVSLRDGRVITVPLVWHPRLLDATASQRKNWKIAGGGYGIHWPRTRRGPEHRRIAPRRARAEGIGAREVGQNPRPVAENATRTGHPRQLR